MGLGLFGTLALEILLPDYKKIDIDPIELKQMKFSYKMHILT